MKVWIVKEGTDAKAVIFSGYGSPTIVDTVIKEETLYFEEDIAIDPLGKFGASPQHNTIGGDLAKKGYYGFKLPKNSKGYEVVLVHSIDVDVK